MHTDANDINNDTNDMNNLKVLNWYTTRQAGFLKAVYQYTKYSLKHFSFLSYLIKFILKNAGPSLSKAQGETCNL